MKKKIVIILVKMFGGIIIRFLFSTIKFEIHNQNSVEKQDKFILSFFHRYLLIPLWILKNKNIYVLISEHFDGEIISQLVKKFGNFTIRGSSTRGFVKVIKNFKKILEKNSVAITPDGPNGPAYSVHNGIIYLAEKTKLPIICIAGNFKHKIVFNSWDNFILPLPWTKGYVEFSEPIFYDETKNFEENKKEISETFVKFSDKISRKYNIFQTEKIWEYLKIRYRFILSIFSFFYSLIIKFKNFLYDSNIFKTAEFSNIKIISFGNITLGGTGKTQLLEHYIKTFFNNENVIILSSGYKSKYEKFLVVEESCSSKLCGDEPLMLKKNLPFVKVIVSKNRLHTLKILNNQNKKYTVFIDDGFHYRNINYKNNKNKNILIIDVNKNIFKEKMFPAGCLREPISSIKRANCIILNKLNFAAELELNNLIIRLKSINEEAEYLKSYYKIEKIYNIKNNELELKEFNNFKISAFCGIGNPEFFFNILKDEKIILQDTMAFNDHTYYNLDEMAYLKFLYENNDWLLTTEKDSVKLAASEFLHSKLYVVKIKIELCEIKNLKWH